MQKSHLLIEARVRRSTKRGLAHVSQNYQHAHTKTSHTPRDTRRHKWHVSRWPDDSRNVVVHEADPCKDYEVCRLAFPMEAPTTEWTEHSYEKACKGESVRVPCSSKKDAGKIRLTIQKKWADKVIKPSQHHDDSVLKNSADFFLAYFRENPHQISRRAICPEMCFFKGIELNPNFSLAYNNLGNTLPTNSRNCTYLPGENFAFWTAFLTSQLNSSHHGAMRAQRMFVHQWWSNESTSTRLHVKCSKSVKKN